MVKLPRLGDLNPFRQPPVIRYYRNPSARDISQSGQGDVKPRNGSRTANPGTTARVIPRAPQGMEYAADYVDHPMAAQVPEEVLTDTPRPVADTVPDDSLGDEGTHLDDIPITCVSRDVVEKLEAGLRDSQEPGHADTLATAAYEATLRFLRHKPEWTFDIRGRFGFTNEVCAIAREIFGGNLPPDQQQTLFRIVAGRILRGIILEDSIAEKGKATRVVSTVDNQAHPQGERNERGLSRRDRPVAALDRLAQRKMLEIEEAARVAMDRLLGVLYATDQIAQRRPGVGNTSGREQDEISTLRAMVLALLAQNGLRGGEGQGLPNPPSAAEVEDAFAGLGIKDLTDLAQIFEQAKARYAAIVTAFCYDELDGTPEAKERSARALAQADRRFGVVSRWLQHCAAASASRALAAGPQTPPQINYNMLVIPPGAIPAGAQVFINMGGTQQGAQLNSGQPRELGMPMPHIILGYPDEIGGPRITFPKGADRGKFSANLMRYLTSHLSQHQAMVYQIVNNPESKGKYVVLRFDGVTVALALERIGLDHEAVTNAPRQHGLQVRVLEVWPGTGHSPTLAELVATDERMWPPNFRGGSDNKRGLQNRSDGGGNRSLQSGHGGRKGKGAKVIDITDYL